jgi:hypothetical protein
MPAYNSTGEPWAPDTSHLAFMEIRAKAIKDLNARDKRLSHGRLNAANNFSPYVEHEREHGVGTDLIVDPVLASIKHTGEETQKLTASRWAQFCKKPQSEEAYRAKLTKRNCDDRLDAAIVRGEEVEHSLQHLSNSRKA